jgi:two-component system, OmpR family, response regulator RegX3
MLVSLIQSDRKLVLQISQILEAAGHTVLVFSSGSELLQALDSCAVDLFVVDAKVSDMSGLEVVKKIRSSHLQRTPLLLLISRVDECDVSDVLSVGVDDYCVKPIRNKQLLARVSALIKEDSNLKILGTDSSSLGYNFDAESRSVFFRGKTVFLSEKEFNLAIFLFSNFERALSRKRIVDAVLIEDGDEHSLTNSLDLLVFCLRSKLDLSVTSPILQIKSVYGFGYRLIAVD